MFNFNSDLLAVRVITVRYFVLIVGTCLPNSKDRYVFKVLAFTLA